MKTKKFSLIVLAVFLIALVSACAKMHRMKICPRKADKEIIIGGLDNRNHE